MESLKNHIVEKIKAGEIAMRPRWQYVLSSLLWISAVGIMALSAIYMLSFVFFIFKKSGLWLAPQYGWVGLIFFITMSPWLLISCGLLFVAILYLLVTHYSFSYRRPFVYSLLGVVLLVGLSSSLMHMLAFHDKAEQFSKKHHIPGMAPWYGQIERHRPNGIIQGEIMDITENDITLTTTRGEIIIGITPRTKMPQRPIVIGDTVEIFGNEFNGEIRAFGVRLQNNRSQRPHQPLRNNQQ